MKTFSDYPEFTPNISPKDVFAAGAFGGTYFRPIYSSITDKKYTSTSVIKEYPESWWNVITIETMVTSPKYDKKINKYGVKCGSSLQDWEDNNWIKSQDPYGWFQWYCRFYRGRRTSDDRRQIDRWLKLAGPNGRFRRRLMNMILDKKKNYNDKSVSPVIRQVLLHWGYELTSEDLQKYKKSRQ
jgi:hypothetical protein